MAKRPVHSDPRLPAETGPPARPDRRRQVTMVGVAVAVVLLVWFALANLRDVRIEFWISSRQAPLILVIVISGALGALIGALVTRRRSKEPSD